MCPNPQITADLVTLTEEILDRKLNFVRNVGREKINNSEPLRSASNKFIDITFIINEFVTS